MGRKIKIHTFKCKRCGHEWIPRIPDPASCPKCHSARWNKAKDRSK